MGDNNITLTAPEGFANYTWSSPISVPDSKYPNVATISRSAIDESKDYTCTMSSHDNDPNLFKHGENCTQTTDKFRLTKTPFNMDFDADVACYNEVLLTDKTVITKILHNGDEVKPDTIVNRIWSYREHGSTDAWQQVQGDGITRILPANPGESKTYDVKLTIFTSRDCEQSLEKQVTVVGRPDVEIKGDATVCNGESKELRLTTDAYLKSAMGNYVNQFGNKFKYEWTDEGGNVLNETLEGEDGAKYSVKPTNGTAVYTLYITSMEKSGNNADRECVYDGDHSITVNETPSVTLSANNMKYEANGAKYVEICDGEEAEFSATTNIDGKFYWLGKAEGATKQDTLAKGTADASSGEHTETITQNARYYVTVTTEQGCSGRDSANAIKMEIPTLTIEGSADACVGSDYNYTAKGAEDASSYVWTLASNATIQNPNLNLPFEKSEYEGMGDPIAYTLKLLGKNDNGCSNTISTTINIHQLPTMTVQGETTACEDQPITLSVTGVDSCSVWTGGSSSPKYTDDKHLEMTDTVSATTKMYYVDGFAFHGNEKCKSSLTVGVTVKNAPKSTIIDHAYLAGHICEGEDIYLSGNGASSYEWSDNRDMTNILSNSEELKISAPTNKTEVWYYMKSYNDAGHNGCWSLDSTLITIHKAPEFEVAAEKGLICEGGTDRLSATEITGATADNKIAKFVWDDGTENANYTITLDAGRTFTVTAYNNNQCTSQKTVEVKVVPNPELEDIRSEADKTICENGEATLTVQNKANATYTYTDSYSWTFDNAGIGTDATVKHSPTGTGIVYYTATGARTYTVDGKTATCTSSERFPVNINVAAALTITGHESGVCQDSTVTLTASGAMKGATYTWGVMNGDQEEWGTLTNATIDESSASHAVINATPKTDGNITYIVKGKGTNGCEGETKAILTAYKNPTVTITADKEWVCQNNSVTLSATVADNTEASYAWRLTNEADNSSAGDASGKNLTINMDQTKVFSVTATDIHNCKSKAVDKVITARPYPTISPSADNKDYVCKGLDIKLAVDAANDKTYHWTDGVNESTTNEFEYKNPDFGSASTYQVNLTITKNECSTDTSFRLSVSTPPVVYITGSNQVCAGGSVTLTAKGGAAGKYQWHKADDGTQISDQDAIKQTIDEGTTSFYLVGYDAKGCMGTSENFTVTGHSKPNITIAAASSKVCQGNSVAITAGGSDNPNGYTWKYTTQSGGEKSYACSECGSINPIIQEKVTYTVTGQDSRGCEGTATTTIEAMETPVLELTAAPVAVCKDGSTNLTAVNTNNNAIVSQWTWDDDNSTSGADKDKVTATNITTTRNFTVTATTAEGCTSQKETKVEVYPVEAIGIDKGNGYVCDGGNITLKAIGGASDFNWTRKDDNVWAKSGSTTTLDGVSANTTIYLNAKDANGCATAQAEAEIEFKSRPTVEIDPIGTLCYGDAAQLKAKATDGSAMQTSGWTWYEEGAETGTKVDNMQLTNITAAKKYEVKGLNSFGCESNTAAFTLNVVSEPNLTLTTSDNTVCRGSKVTLTAQTTETGVSITWPNGNVVSGISNQAITMDTTLTIAKTYNFTATVETATGCKATKTVSVTVNDVPTVTITSVTGKNSICEGESLQLIANSATATQYTWTGATADPTDGKLAEMTSHDGDSEINAQVEVSDGLCTANAEFKATVNGKPTITINGETNGTGKVCLGEAFLLTAEGADNKDYQWTMNNAGVGSGLTYNPTINSDATITVSGSNSNGCYNSATFSITPKELPTFTAADQSTCYGQTATIKIENSTATSYDIEWEGGNENNWTNTQYTTEELTAGRTYHITGYLDGCASDKKDVMVTVNALPVIKITSDPLSRRFCQNGTATLTATGGTTYTWVAANGLTVNNDIATVDPSSFDLTKQKEYTFSVTGKNGQCEADASITLTIDALPTVTIDGADAVCQGATAELTAQGARTYVWNTGGTDATIEPTITATNNTFSVTGTDENNCSSTSDVKTITVNSLPQPKWDAVSVCKGEDATITFDKGTTIASVLWKKDGQTTGNSREFNDLTEDMYLDVTVSSDNNCTKDTTVTIKVNDVPTISFSGSENICSGNDFKVTATAPDCNFTWTGTEGATVNGAIVTGNIAATTDKKVTYTATATNAANCSTTADFSFTVHAPKVNSINVDGATANGEICEGSTVTLTSVGTFDNYSWTVKGEANNVISAEKETTVKPDKETTYVLTAETSASEGGCPATAETTISIVKKPTFDFEYVKVCEGEDGTVKLKNPSANATYKWTYKTETSQDDNGIHEVTTKLDKDETFKVLAQSTIIPTCQTENSMIAEVKAKPNFSILTDRTNNEMCSGETANIYATNDAYAYDWYEGDYTAGKTAYKAATPSINETISNADASDITKTFTARAVSDGCANTSDVTITVHPKAKFSLEQSGVACEGENVTVKVKDGADRTATSFVWLNESKLSDGGKTGESQVFTIPEGSSADYHIAGYVVGSTTDGCPDTVAYEITKVAKPVIKIDGNDPICSGTAPTGITLSGATTYTWYKGATATGTSIGQTGGNSTETVESIIGTLNSNQFFTIQAQGGASTCVADTSFEIKVVQRPDLVLETSKKDACPNDKVTLTAKSASSTPIGNYKWEREQGGNWVAISGVTSASTDVLEATQGTYQYRVTAEQTTNGTTCDNSATVKVNYQPTPSVTIVADNQEICNGETATIYTVGTSYSSYTWEEEELHTTIKLKSLSSNTGTLKETPKTATTYKLEVSNEYGCKGFDTLTISVREYPIFNITIDDVCANSNAKLNISANSTALITNMTNGVKNAAGEWTTANPIAARTGFTISATNKDGFCGKDTTVYAETLPEPVAQIYVDGIATNNEAVEICPNTQIKLQAKSTQSTIAETAWETIDGGKETVANEAEITNTPSKSGSYTATVKDDKGCTTTLTQMVTVSTPSQIEINTPANFCEGEDVTLTATNAESYAWTVTTATGGNYTNVTYEDATQSTITIKNVTEKLNVFATGTDAKGCSASQSDTKTLTPTAKPTLTLNAISQVCSGETFTLSAQSDANATVQWAGQAEKKGSSDYTISTVAAETKSTETYTVTVSDNSNCTNTQTVSVDIMPVPTLLITQDDAFCAGGKAQLSASEKFGSQLTYSWYKSDDANKTEISNQSTAEVGEAGTYIVKGTDGNGCSSEKKASPIISYSNPVVTITTDKTACIDSTITLTAQGDNYTYEWFKKDGATETPIGSGESQKITVYANTETYAVKAREIHGSLTCQSETETDVNGKPSPTWTFKTADVCEGKTANISIEDGSYPTGTTFAWTYGNNPATDGTSVTTDAVNGSVTYSVTGTLDGCTHTEQVTVNSKALPIINNIDAPNEVCEGNSITLTADPSDNTLTYNWTVNGSALDNKSAVTYDASTLTAGNYSYSLSIDNGCESKTKDGNFTILSKPTIALEGETTYCPNSQTSIGVKGGMTSIIWYASDKNGTEGAMVSSGSGSDKLTETVTETTYYILKVNNGQCDNQEHITVSTYDTPHFNISGSQTICEGSQAELNISGTKSGDKCYVDVNGTRTEVAGGKHTFSPTVTTDYNIYVESGNGCTNDTTITINVEAKPDVTINDLVGGSGSICYGGSMDLKANSSVVGVTYEWENGLGDNADITVTPNATTTYTVSAQKTISGGNICESQTQFTVNVNALPDVKITGADYACKGATAEFGVTSTGDYNYLWEDGSINASRSEVIDADKTFTLTVTDKNTQCSNNFDHKVTVKELPTIKLMSGGVEVTTLSVCKNATMPDVVAESNIAGNKNTYSWTEDNAEKSKTATLTGQVINSTRHFVAHTQTEFGCAAEKDLEVNFLALPVVEITGDATVCNNSKASLTATATEGAGNYVYTWSVDKGTYNASGNKFEATFDYGTQTSCTVSVAAKDGNECESEKVSHTISVRPTPTVTITPSATEVCEGSTVDLTADGAGNNGTYEWNTGETNDKITATIADNTTFTVVGSDMDGCQSEPASVTINKKDLPKFAIEGNQWVCEGSSTDIEIKPATTGAEVLWVAENDVNYTAAISNAKRTLSPISTSTYTVRVKVGGCFLDSTFTVAVNALPVVQINGYTTGGATAICSGNTAALNASSGLNNYTWYKGEVSSATQITSDIAGIKGNVLTVSESGDYIVTADNGHCSAQATYSVTVNDLPTFTLVGPAAACNQEDVTISINPDNGQFATNYNWGALGAASTAHEATFTMGSNNENFEVTATDAQGCKAKASIDIQSLALPDFTLTANQDICEGEKVTLQASNSNYTYTWPNGGTASGSTWTENATQTANIVAYTYEVAASETHTVNAQTYTCSAKNTANVTVHDLPTITITGVEFICQDETSTTWTVEPTNATYQWQKGSQWTEGAAIVNAGQETLNQFSVEPADEGTSYYTVKVTEPNHNCENTKTVSIYKAETPEFELANETVGVCEGETANLKFDNPNGYNLEWSDGLGSNETANIKDVTASLDGKKYTLTAIASTNCKANKVYELAVKETPKLTINAPNYVCYDNEVVVEASGAQVISWTGSTEKADGNGSLTTLTVKKNLREGTTFRFVGTNTYEYTAGNDGSKDITNTLTCSNNAEKNIEVKALPTVNITGENRICANTQLTLTATAQGTVDPYNYAWKDTSKVAGTATDEKFAIQPTLTTTYKVHVTDGNGCVDSASHTVTVDTLPRFTIIGDNIVCDLGTVSLTASDKRLQYDWTETNNFASFQYTTPQITGDKTVTVIAKNGNGCLSEKVTHDIVWKKNPIIDIAGANDPVCRNENVQLTATETQGLSTQFYWNGESTATDTWTTDAISEPKQFSVTAVTEDKCSSTQTVTVSMRELPTISIAGDKSVCEGSSLTLTAKGGERYAWTEDETTTPVFTNDVNDTHDVSEAKTLFAWGVDQYGCKNKATATVSIDELPNFTITGDTVVCLNGETTLTANSVSGINTFSWTASDGSSASNQNTFTLTNITSDVEVTVLAETNKGCQKSSKITVTAKKAPTIASATGDFTTTICKGEKADLAIQNIENASILWKDADDNVIDRNVNKINPEVSTSNTRYTVEAAYTYKQYETKEVECSASETFTVNTHELPIVEITGDGAICKNEKVQLSATENADYQYQWYRENMDKASTQRTCEETPTQSTTFYVEVTDENGCKNKASHSVVVNALPTFTLDASNSAVCIGEEVTVKASNPALAYDWDNTGYQSHTNHEITISKDTTLEVKAMDLSTTCVAQKSISITKKDRPDLLLKVPTYVCEGDATSSMSGQNPQASYTWKLNDEFGSVVSNSSECPISALTSDQTYYVIAEHDGCTSDSTVVVTVAPRPNIMLQATPSNTICLGSTVTLMATGGVSYKWEEEGDTYVNTDSKNFVNTRADFSYKIWGVDAKNCENTASIDIKVLPLPTFELAGEPGYCKGAIATLSANNNALSYSWSSTKDMKNVVSRSQTFKPTISKNDTFYVEGTDKSGCVNETPMQVTVQAYDYPVVTLSAPAAVCPGDIATVKATTDSTCTFVWNKNNQQTADEVSLAINRSTNFSVVATAHGCATTSSTTVGINAIPTINADKATVCKGESATLSANSTSIIQSWYWVEEGSESDTLAKTATWNTPEIGGRTTYIANGKDENGCVGKTEVTVSTYNDIDFKLSGDEEVCYGSQATISASNPSLSYNWGNGFKSDLSLTVDITKDTTFTVIGKSNDGCTVTKTFSVKVKTLPTISVAMDNDYVCFGGERTIQASGANSYKWSTGETSKSITLTNVEETQNVWVVGTAANGCESRIDTIINIWALPDIQISADREEICLESSVTLTATGGATYKWTTPNGVNTDQTTVTPTTAGSAHYEVIGTDANGCVNTATKDIIVYSAPDIEIPAVAPVCRGTEATISAQGSASYYEWTVDGSNKVFASTATITPKVTPAADETSVKYNVKATDMNGCETQASITVSVKEFPVLAHRTSTGKDSVCKGEPLTIYLENANEWKWLDNNSEETFRKETLSSQKTFYVEGTTDGCTTKDTIIIGVWANPDFEIDGTQEVCFGSEIALTAKANNAANTYQYEWLGKDGNPRDAITETANTATSPRTYTVRATDGNNCKSTETFNVKINALPTVTIVGARDTAICDGTEITRLVSSTATDHTWYSADAIDGTWTTRVSGDELTTNVSGQLYISVKGVDVNGCENTDTIKVTTKPFPVLTFESADFVCMGEQTTVRVSGATSYDWGTTDGVKNELDNNGKVIASSITETMTAEKTFTVTGTTNGCSTTDSRTVDVRALPSIEITTLNPTNEICKTDSITLNAQFGESGKYVWKIEGTNETISTKDDITVSPADNTTYRLYGEDANGCKNEATYDLVVNPLPDIRIDGETAVCTNNDVQLTAVSKSNISTYLWGDGETKAIVTATIDDTKTFTLTVEDFNGCKKDTFHTVTAKAIPNIQVEAPKYICQKESAEITLTGADRFENAQFEEILNGKMTITPSADTTFTVTGYVGDCPLSKEITMPVMMLPNIWISATKDEICRTVESSVLTANGANTYQWADGTTTSSRTESPTETKTYKVYGTDANLCSNWSEEFTLTVNAAPIFEIGGDDEVCSGDQATLFVTYDKTLEGAASSYSWTNTGEQKDTINPTINQSTTYVVIGQNLMGCSATRQKTVTMKTRPIISTDVPAYICEGGDLHITATGADTYTWDGVEQAEYNQTNVANSQTITLVGTTNGCSTTDQIIVNVQPKPYVWITGERDICTNETVDLTAEGAVSYEWSNGRPGSIMNETKTSVGDYFYHVTGTDANGCSYTTADYQVTVHGKPTITISGDEAVCNGGVGQLTASGANEYSWNTGERDASIYPIITENKTFVVTGTDVYGCFNDTSFTVENVEYPILSYNAPKKTCKGDTATVYVMGATRYIFNGDTTVTDVLSLKEPLDNSKTYNVVGDIKGCQRNISFNVDVLQLPNIWITGASSVCKNGTVQLSATGGLTYEWTNDKSENIISKSAMHNARPTETTTYTVKGTDVNKCSSTNTFTVTIDSLPKFEIDGPSETCEGSAITLKIKDGDALNYAWSNGANSTSITPVIEKSTSFTVEATGANNCKAKKTHNVRSNPYPALAYTGPSEVCSKDKVEINVTGADTYTWSNDPNNKSSKMTDYPEGTTVYTIEGISRNCVSKLNVTVNVLPIPALTYQGNTNICLGDKLTLNAYGANTYRWNQGLNRSRLESYPTESAIYTVTGTDVNGCRTTIEIPVTVNQKPDFEILADDSICRGFIAELKAVGNAETYYWGFGTNTTDDAHSADGETVYQQIDKAQYVFVKAMDQNGCYTIKNKDIKLKETPIIHYTGTDEICLGDSIKLQGHGAETYEWTYGNDQKMEGENFNIVPIGNTRVTLKGTKGSCSSEIEINVKANVSPNVEITSLDSIVCTGDSAILIADGASEYIWSTNTTGRILVLKDLTQKTTVYVEGISTNGCTKKVDYTVDVRKRPDLWVRLKDMQGCPGTETTATILAGGATFYEWQSEPTNGEISGNTSNEIVAQIDELTRVTVTASDESGCYATAELLLDTLTHKPIQFEVDPSIILEENPIVTMKGIYPENAEWSWDTGDDEGTTLTGKTATYHYPNPSTRDSFTITATAIDDRGCERTADSTIYVWKKFWVPNAFSPNEDGLNDVFRLMGTEFLTGVHFIIYNRVGTIMYEGFDVSDSWNGKFNNVECPMGIYGYVIDWESDFRGIKKSGTERGVVNLIR